MKWNWPELSALPSNGCVRDASTTIAIIGAGPRGLSILERLIAFARASQLPVAVQVKIFDPQGFGFGCHSVDQADHLLVNTIASQITVFSDATVQGSGILLVGPSFYEWLCDHSAEIPDPNAYYSRKLLGEYLAWSFQYLCELAPPSLQITPVPQSIVAAEPNADEHKWQLKTNLGDRLEVDYVFLTTGHAHESPNRDPFDRRLFAAYPLEKSTLGVQSHETVAIEGLGLSTCDVISTLTIGRGGKFMRDHQGCLQYYPSQQEPKIIGFSRSGLPLSARAKNQKEVREQYKAYFLTREAIADLKAEFGQLDFSSHIMPLLLADMELVYSKTYIQKNYGYAVANRFANDYLNAPECQRKILVMAAIPPDEQFDWERLAQPLLGGICRDRQQFSAWLLDYLQADLRHANEGNVSNPLKAACDVLRDVRDNLRYAIDFAGLTAESHRWLLQTFLPVMNRLAVGPPKIRLEEMLALQSAGILKLDLGPNPQWEYDESQRQFVITGQFEQVKADVLIRSRIPMPSPQASSNLLLRQLIEDGWARPFMNGEFQANGLDVSPDLNLLDVSQQAQSNFWVLGTPIEGPKFYTFILPRPFVNSTALVDADRVVQSLCDQMHRQVMEVNINQLQMQLV